MNGSGGDGLKDEKTIRQMGQMKCLRLWEKNDGKAWMGGDERGREEGVRRVGRGREGGDGWAWKAGNNGKILTLAREKKAQIELETDAQEQI